MDGRSFALCLAQDIIGSPAPNNRIERNATR